MKIDKITFTGQTMGQWRSAVIIVDGGKRLNAWYDPQTMTLTRANSLPRAETLKSRFNMSHYRQRNLESAHGRKLMADFRAYAKEHEAAAIKAIEDEKERKEQERLAAIVKQQEDRLQAIADAIRQHDPDISIGNALGIVNRLMDAGYIDRNG